MMTDACLVVYAVSFFACAVHLAGVIAVVIMQSTFQADKVLEGRMGRRCDRFCEILCGWLREARNSGGVSIMVMRDSILHRAAPEVWALASVCMEEGANEQVRADEHVLEIKERELRGKLDSMCKYADRLKKRAEAAEGELLKLGQQLGQTAEGEEQADSGSVVNSYGP